jgi:hypothetical protein
MTFKISTPKNWLKIGVVTQNTASLCMKQLITTLVLKKKADFFPTKICENR